MSTTYRKAPQGTVECRDHDDDKITGWPLLAFWVAASALCLALMVVAAKSLARLAALVGLLSLVCVTTAGAQTFTSTQSKPPVCTVECPAGPPGRDGRHGRDGRDGADGRDGKDAVTPPVPALRPFDLGVHGFDFTAAEFNVVDGRWMVLTFERTTRTALLIDPATCLAQVHLNFTAGLVAPLLFDRVQWVTPDTSVWWHGGALWSWRWQAGLPVVNLHALTFNDPRLGAGTALCRWRDQ